MLNEEKQREFEQLYPVLTMYCYNSCYQLSAPIRDRTTYEVFVRDREEFYEECKIVDSIGFGLEVILASEKESAIEERLEKLGVTEQS